MSPLLHSWALFFAPMSEQKVTATRRTKILVVEDDVLIATMIEQRLRGMGYEIVSVVNSGERAIEQARKIAPDLVLMNIQLAGEMDGIEAAEQIHARMSIPVIYLTANDDEHTLERITRTEPFGYLLKPFSDAELRVAIEVALYKAQAENILKEREARFRSIVQDQSDLICRYGIDGNLCFVNNAYCADFTQEAQALLGTSLYHSIFRQDRDKVRELLRSLAPEHPMARNLNIVLFCLPASCVGSNGDTALSSNKEAMSNTRGPDTTSASVNRLNNAHKTINDD